VDNPITEYKVVESNNSEELGKTVTELLGKGWELYGMPFAFKEGEPGAHASFFQTMVKPKWPMGRGSPFTGLR
jgi:hypothetical protein